MHGQSPDHGEFDKESGRPQWVRCSEGKVTWSKSVEQFTDDAFDKRNERGHLFMQVDFVG